MSPDKKADGFSKKNWREIAEEMQTEQDPTKIIGLVQQLISRLDEEYPFATVPENTVTGSNKPHDSLAESNDLLPHGRPKQSGL